MARLAPPVAAVRVAIRRALTASVSTASVSTASVSTASAAGTVLVACSGGPDSLALAAAARFVAPRLGLGVGLVTVDHQLQPGSAERAAELVAWARAEGFAPAVSLPVEVGGRPGGPEAAARDARYTALVAVARHTGATAVLLGHTRDDQAETVLLALARGAGPRGMSGMPGRRVIDGVTFLRPLLDVARVDTHAACTALGLTPWHDPHNGDPGYARARVRALLPDLVAALGPGVVGNLARSATLLAADAATLDALAGAAASDAVDADGALRVAAVAELPAALRTRVLHGWVRGLGVPGSALSARHVTALDALVTAWRGQGPVALPGGTGVARRAGRLVAS